MTITHFVDGRTVTVKEAVFALKLLLKNKKEIKNRELLTSKFDDYIRLYRSNYAQA